jgi:ribonuclease E
MTDTEGEAEEPAFAHEPEPAQPFEPQIVERHATERQAAERQASEHHAEHAAEPPTREPPAAERPPVEASVSEISRRRSTVREPAPISVAGEHGATHEPASPAPSEPPRPVVISPTDSEEADRPRRSGWWSRRVLGKD